ncbi:uncharacterized protein LOC144647886 [Oculina patagonica]
MASEDDIAHIEIAKSVEEEKAQSKMPESSKPDSNCLAPTPSVQQHYQVQQLAIFLAEQNEHKAHLKQQRLSKAKPKKSTKEATIQCDRQATADSKHTSEVAVQTDFPVYLMEDLREQVRQP